MLATLYHLIGYTFTITNSDVYHVGKKYKNKLFSKNLSSQSVNIIENRLITYNSM